MICQRCHAFEDDGKLLEQMQAYLKRMDPEICCEDAEYESRLLECEQCPSMINGVCKFCGCFVILRAKKKNSTCPEPTGDRWMNKKEK
jgi:hypothetical protein